MKLRSKISGVCLCFVAAMFVLLNDGQVFSKEEKSCIRVGIYDSRAVAIAYGNSKFIESVLEAKKQEYKEAKEKEDQERIKELEAWGEEHQHQAHLRAFCGTPVQEYLKVIEEKIPQIAREANVDLIVSKWQIDFQSESIQLIDVTDKLVKCYNPQEKALKWIDDLKGKDLIPIEQIEKHRH